MDLTTLVQHIYSMSEYVAIDTASPHGGTEYFLVGVAVEIGDRESFQKQYFDWVERFAEEYEIEIPFPVIKSRDIVDQLPSYEVRDRMNRLVKGLLRNSGISRINVSIGWYNEEVDFIFNDKDPMRGINYTSKHLEQFFNAVTAWQYHRSHKHNLAQELWLDELQGHITKAWKYIGNEFDINIVPHGDQTYPALSVADILAYNTAGFLGGHDTSKFTEYPEVAEDWLVAQKEEANGSCYIHADFVNERETDHIVPTLPYTIQSSIHHPHPVLFVHDTVLSGDDRKILKKSDFHAFARKWAFEQGGCVVNLQTEQLSSVLRDGDKIVYTKGTGDERAKLFTELHPTKDVEILRSDELISTVLGH